MTKVSHARAQQRVLFVLYGNPATYPPIVRAASILQRLGCEVRLVGTYGQKVDGLDAREIEGLDLRLVARGAGGIRLKLGYFIFVVRALWEIARWRPVWLYASDSYATPIAWLGSLGGARVIYHEHDIPDTPGSSRFMQLVLATRRAVLRQARAVVVPSEGRAAVLRALRGAGETIVVWNCPSRAEMRDHAPGDADRALRVAYQGSIVPARLPMTVIDAIAAMRQRACLTIIGYETVGAPGYVESLVRRAAALGIGDRVIFLGRVPTARKLQVAAESDLGLALMPMQNADVNERTMAGASNKPFEYLGCGTPLLVSDLPDWREMFVKKGVALTCNPGDVHSVVAALEWGALHRESLSAMGRDGRSLVDREWNYEARFQRVAALILGGPAQPDQPRG